LLFSFFGEEKGYQIDSLKFHFRAFLWYPCIDCNDLINGTLSFLIVHSLQVYVHPSHMCYYLVVAWGTQLQPCWYFWFPSRIKIFALTPFKKCFFQ
jgi:hypothetical protein